ncbi:hypothetical protein TNCV_4059891 [Trichonephila clavipes]|nr:hypothetical protein TNCV_4059891 [Trichonephila clavipes]
MVLKANNRRTSCPCHDEFRGPRSDYVRQVNLFPSERALLCSPCKKNPTLSTMKRMKTRTITTTKVARVHQIADAFSALETVMERYKQQSAVLLNYCCSRESETL